MTHLRLTAAALLGALALASLSGCARTSTEGGIEVAGDTRVDLLTVAAPRLTTPTVDVTVGFPKAQAAGGARPRPSAGSAGGVRRPLPAGRLATVTVRPGDIVRKGQVVAVFDDTLLRLGVQDAEAADRRNAAAAGALSAQASDLRDTQAQLRDQRAQLDTALAQLQRGIAGEQQLVTAIGQLKGGIAQTKAGLAKLGAARAQLAGKLAEAEASAETSPAPPGIEGVIAKLKAQIAGIDAQAAKLQATLAKLQATLAKLQAQLAQLRGKLPPDTRGTEEQLQAGKEKIASALSQLSSGIDQLESASAKVEAAQGVRSVGVEAAKAALAQATLRAPADGVVVSAMHAGEVVMVGGPVVVMRPAGATLVDTYLTHDQLDGVRLGTSAEVRLDSVRGVLEGEVDDIGREDEFAPSNFPTQIVHLSRVVRVTVSVPDTLPLGVPADVVIRPRP